MRRITFCGGRAASYKAPTRDSRAEAVSWFERALELAPESVDAQSLLASALACRALDRMTDTPAEDFARAEALARRVLAVSPRSSMAHYAYGQVLRASVCVSVAAHSCGESRSKLSSAITVRGPTGASFCACSGGLPPATW